MALVDLYHRSIDGFVDRVRKVRPDQWSAATPCSEWDVRTLVNHIVYEDLWSVPLFEGATIAEVGDKFEGDLLGDDPVDTVVRAADDAKAAVVGHGTMEREVHLSFGDTPAAEYVHQLFADHIIHSWDLAAAIGADRRLDPEAVRACLEWFAGVEEAYRGSGAIGPRVDIPADASDQDRLLAAFGRDPHR